MPVFFTQCNAGLNTRCFSCVPWSLLFWAWVALYSPLSHSQGQMKVELEDRQRVQDCFYLLELDSSSMCEVPESHISTGSIILIMCVNTVGRDTNDLNVKAHKWWVITNRLFFQCFLFSGCLFHRRFPLPTTDCWSQGDGAIPKLCFLGGSWQYVSGKPTAFDP